MFANEGPRFTPCSTRRDSWRRWELMFIHDSFLHLRQLGFPPGVLRRTFHRVGKLGDRLLVAIQSLQGHAGVEMNLAILGFEAQRQKPGPRRQFVPAGCSESEHNRAGATG